MRHGHIVLIFLALFSRPVLVHGGEFYDEPYLFRLALALNRQSNYASTLGRQASVAYPQGSSINPGADDWIACQEVDIVVTVTNVNGWTESGAWITATAFTLNVQVPEGGTWSLAYARTDTVDQDVRGGFHNELRSNEFFAGYSKKLSDQLSIGGQVRVTDGQVQQEILAVLPVLGDQAIRQETDLLDIGLNVGLLLALTNKWTAGITAGFAWGTVETDTFSLVDIGGFGISAGDLLRSLEDDVRSWSITSGLGFAPTDSVGVYLDLQYVHLESNNGGSVDIGRVGLGVEFKQSELLSIQCGGIVDSAGQLSYAAGLSFYGIKGIPVEFAYQYNSAPELRREFGNFQLISLSIIIPF